MDGKTARSVLTAASTTPRRPQPMPFHIDLRKVLVGAPRDLPLRVRGISFESVRARCAASGVRVGDRITCLGANSEHLLLELATRERVTLGLALSVCVEVDIDDEYPRHAPRGLVS